MDKVRVGRLAGRQSGRITAAQLGCLGVQRGRQRHWLDTGYLIPRLPRVYTVGHCAPSTEADLWEAVLYAGPGAGLTHMCGAWWRRLIDYPPESIEVSTPRHARSRPGIVVHGPRPRHRYWCHGVPVLSISETMLGLASEAELPLVLKALGRLDFRRQLVPQMLLAICHRGSPGAATLRKAVLTYDPRWGRTNQQLELDFLAFCVRHRIPLPEIDLWLHGIQIDAHWPAQRLIVQLDGEGNHGAWAQIRRDRANDLTLRQHGFIVLRYDWDQVHYQPTLVRDDIIAHL